LEGASIKSRQFQVHHASGVLTEARAGHTDQSVRDAQSKLLASYIRNAIGPGVEVVVGEPGKIERSAGNARRAVDLRGK
jgi:phenylacetate-CoA ligase